MVTTRSSVKEKDKMPKKSNKDKEQKDQKILRII
jgi:hypothetical protein